MRIALPQPPREDIKRLEAKAAARPKAYRTRLVLLALTGDILLTLVRVLPFAGPIVIGALLIGNVFIIGLAAVAVVLLIWLTRSGIRNTGIGITRQDVPQLYAALDELKTKLDVGGRIDVHLDDAFNAGAREGRGLFGLFGTRRVLTLGLPLLALLGRDEARAVIAHELGHFSRRHGRFGHWLYWAHLDWLSHANNVDADSSLLERAGAVMAESFVPAFSRRAMVWSRRCEYEADADAALAVDGAQIASALARIAAFETWHTDELPRVMRAWQQAEPSPPQDYLQRVIAAFEGASPDLLATIASNEMARADDWLDTHPSLAGRAAALGVAPDFTPHGGPSGSVLLGSHWSAALAEYNARWLKEHAVAWSAAHARHRLIDAPLLAADPAAVAQWPVAQRLARARAIRRIEPVRGLAELEALHATAPDDRGVRFAYAGARLRDGDASAVKTLTELAKEDASWAEQVYGRLLQHYQRIGDRARANGVASRLQDEMAARQRARASIEALNAGSLRPSSRPAPFVESLRAGLMAEPAVAKAWLLQGQMPFTTTAQRVDVQVDALILIVDPFDAAQNPNDVDAVKARQLDELADLLEQNGLPVVISFYTTQPMPAPWRTLLEQQPANCIHVR